MTARVIHGDCLEVMATLPDASIDMILCDLPYGTTACAWDQIIPFDRLWEQYERLIKPKGAIVLTASQPFTSALVMSNPKLFRYSWVWDKGSVSNPQLAKFQPLKSHEDILVFSKKTHVYQPQGLIATSFERRMDSSNIGHCQRKDYVQTATNYPKSVVAFGVERGLHPTQKPVDLFEYLIRTYTRPGDVVLDNCAGSGTTGVAAIQCGRQAILIEQDSKYHAIAEHRVRNAIPALLGVG